MRTWERMTVPMEAYDTSPVNQKEVRKDLCQCHTELYCTIDNCRTNSYFIVSIDRHLSCNVCSAVIHLSCNVMYVVL